MSIETLCDWGEQMQPTPLQLQVERVYRQRNYHELHEQLRVFICAICGAVLLFTWLIKSGPFLFFHL